MNAIQTLLTENIGIWAVADTEKKSGRGRSSGNATSVYGIRKLRELILELAVLGKLVPQDPHDEPAIELLKRIQTEKEKLIAEGRIKKDQLPRPITEEEKTFELPQGWEWVRLGQAVEVLDSLRKPVTQQEREPGPYPYYGASGIVDYVSNFIFDEPLILVGEDGAKWGRGENTAFLISGKTWVNNHAHVIRPNRSALIDDFVALSLNAMDLGAFITGMTVPKLNQARLVSILLPLPPLSEQSRIVTKVSDLMALCDQLEAQHNSVAAAHEKLVSHLLGTLTQSHNAEDFGVNWQRIAAHFDTLFVTEASIDALKQTLLQLAVMGKLVPQDPKDEPATELLKGIQAEKAKLIAVGKIKKVKPLAPIPDDEKPFELPRSWGWVRLDDLMPEFQNGASSRGDSDGVPVVVLRLADIKDRCISLEDQRELLISPSMIDKYRLSNGDILVVRVNGSADLVGGFVVCEKDFNGIYCDHFIRMKISHSIMNPAFLGLVGASQLVRERIKELFVTTAGQKTVNQGHIGSLLIPLLSIAEQNRIVTKHDELMALCDQLKTRITQANQLQQKLADVMVEQAA